MKAAMAVLIVLGTAALFLLAADGIESEGLTITGSATPTSGPMDIDAQSMEDKIADLQSGPVSNGDQSNNKHSTFFNIGIDTVQSNGSIVNLSKLINLSSNDSTNSTAKNASIINSKTLNWTVLNTTASGATAVNASDRKNSVTSYATGIGSVSGSTAVGPEGVSTSSQSSSKGTQNYSSSQGGLGKSKIKSSMSLEGDFEVQRSSSY
ncbi:MAG: hypothetical protein ACP5OM_01845 [Methanothrix sp.]